MPLIVVEEEEEEVEDEDVLLLLGSSATGELKPRSLRALPEGLGVEENRR